MPPGVIDLWYFMMEKILGVISNVHTLNKFDFQSRQEPNDFPLRLMNDLMTWRKYHIIGILWNILINTTDLKILTFKVCHPFNLNMI